MSLAHIRHHEMSRPNIDEWLARRVLAGWKPQAIVAAADGKVSVRTVQRWRASLIRLEVIQLDGWEAVFAIRRECPPVRIGSWTQFQ